MPWIFFLPIGMIFIPTIYVYYMFNTVTSAIHSSNVPVRLLAAFSVLPVAMLQQNYLLVLLIHWRFDSGSITNRASFYKMIKHDLKVHSFPIPWKLTISFLNAAAFKARRVNDSPSSHPLIAWMLKDFDVISFILKLIIWLFSFSLF